MFLGHALCARSRIATHREAVSVTEEDERHDGQQAEAEDEDRDTDLDTRGPPPLQIVLGDSQSALGAVAIRRPKRRGAGLTCTDGRLHGVDSERFSDD